ncbi:AraC family transcriptional regulator [Pseudarcicella hirudinis]|uniref:AraC family transcriptional regulator n=1 Tax=Pseudarcicella hirudinis TaxID=1079859 RepID=UPI0035E5E48F
MHLIIFHPEFELTLIVKKAMEKRFVGNQVNDFQAGDLVLLGSDLPHCWQNNHFSNDEEAAQSIVIQFKEDFIGEKFFQSPEAKPIRDLLQNAKCGIQITGKTRDRIAKEIQFLLHASPFQRLLGLLDLLNTIANSNDIQLIDKQQGVYNLSQIDLKRINKVYAYVISHYTQEVHLDEAAHLANMTETAFCRYFKKVTKKTFLDLVTEFRVKHACNLLTSTEKPVSEICFESGFGNISHFNKQFKGLMNMSPLNYRKIFASL